MAFTSDLLCILKRKLDEHISECTSSDGNGPYLNAVIAGVSTNKETVYFKSAGVRNIETGEPVKDDDIFALFSCTKAITSMGLFKLYEENKVDLDRPVKEYLPEIVDFKVIEKGLVNYDGSYKTIPKESTTDITIKHLLLHTSGFSYGMLDADYVKLASKIRPNVDIATEAFLFPSRALFTPETMPLKFDPGSNWLYGHSTDFLGLVIEKITGKFLGEYLKEVIFDPAGMTSCTFHIRDPSNIIKTHTLGDDGSLSLHGEWIINLDPEIDMGGHGCFSNAEDYLKFMRIFLLGGLSPDTGERILKKETIEYMVQNHLPTGLFLPDDANSFPIERDGIPPDGFTLSGHAFGFCELTTRRPEESLSWGGLPNIFYWMDLKNGIAGFWGSQIIPMGHITCAKMYEKFESYVYEFCSC
ncbi:uncharacterized protein PRCAT00004527001 [Priceomyces carsonii]|uniref:uncharacterized protein n=1 Tax=Priceomyces carsonii TaxID=28549 RepID=UPI002ED7C236|nr:unnamed protein product [Priceomyces carsonii]